jgi:hypothetical protein
MKKILFTILLLILFGCGKEKDTETKAKNNNKSVQEKLSENESKPKAHIEGELFTEKLIKNFYLDIEDSELIIEFYEAQKKKGF